jgi:hypothetical protein
MTWTVYNSPLHLGMIYKAVDSVLLGVSYSSSSQLASHTFNTFLEHIRIPASFFIYILVFIHSAPTYIPISLISYTPERANMLFSSATSIILLLSAISLAAAVPDDLVEEYSQPSHPTTKCNHKLTMIPQQKKCPLSFREAIYRTSRLFQVQSPR